MKGAEDLALNADHDGAAGRISRSLTGATRCWMARCSARQSWGYLAGQMLIQGG